MIEAAYRVGEQLGIPVWCEDEAGPYQAIPHPGQSWQPEGHPGQQPHEYVRGGTAKLLTLFRPRTGELRAIAVPSCPNAVLHPWLQAELADILAHTPPGPLPADPNATRAMWERWQAGLASPVPLPEGPLPPVRLLLIWDNLAGHKTPPFVQGCLAQGIVPLYTPLGGSWLNMAESVQRIIVSRALAGQHPRDAQTLMDWLMATVRGWSQCPTPFEWGGKRAARRQRARARRHALGGSGAYTRQPIPRQWPKVA